MAQKCCSQKKWFVPTGKNMKHYVANSLFTVKGESMSAGLPPRL